MKALGKWFFLILVLTLGMLLPMAVLAVDPVVPPVTTNVNSSAVSGYTGGVNVTIPIEAPTGSGGLTPGLALTYSSMSLDELSPTVYSSQVRCGKGWILSGLISIQRKGTGEEYYLVMGGSSQKLFYCSTDGYYYTELDSYTRIKKESAYWWMKTKDGTYYRLGYNDESRHVSDLNYQTSTLQEYCWNVDLVEDIYGNQMYYAYQEYESSYHHAEPIWRLNSITYTKRSGVTVGSDFTVVLTTTGSYTITEYTSPQPWLESYENKLYYSSIEVKVAGALQRKYVLNYSGNVSDYMLSSVSTYGADGTTALPLTSFTYNTPHIEYPLIATVNNGQGGIKSYAWYSYFNGSRHRVTSETSDDGLGHTYTTTYQYGDFSFMDNEFRGHNWVKTIDAEGNYTQTNYFQDKFKKGVAYYSETKSASGAMYSNHVNTYAATHWLEQVEAGSDGAVYARDCNNQFLKWMGTYWKEMGSSIKELSVWNNNEAFCIGMDDKVWCWNGSGWTDIGYSWTVNFKSIAAQNTNNIWVLDQSGQLRSYAGNWGIAATGVGLLDLAVKSNGTVFGVSGTNVVLQYNGSAWVGYSSDVPITSLSTGYGSYLYGVATDHGFWCRASAWAQQSFSPKVKESQALMLVQTDNYVFDGGSDYVQTQTQSFYDAYGNVIKASSLGNTSIATDNLYTYAEYINDTTNWILGVPKHTVTKKSDDATIVAEAWNYYSDAYNGTSDYGTSKKYLRKTETAKVFGSQGNAENPKVQYDYDEYGNVTKVKDPLNLEINTAYDSTFHMFPVSVTNSLGQTAYTYYYGVCVQLAGELQ